MNTLLKFDLMIIKINYIMDNLRINLNFEKFANILTLIGALLVANAIFLHGYIFFFGGALMWFMIAMQRGDKDLMLLNACFICLNIYGFINLGSL